MVEENINWELMGEVFRDETSALRTELKKSNADKQTLANDRKILIDMLVKHMPELEGWIKRNMQ